MQAALGIDAAIDAEDLALLDSVFGEWCIKYNVLKSSPEAQVIARQIIDLFEHGWKTHAELSAMLGPLSGENA